MKTEKKHYPTYLSSQHTDYKERGYVLWLLIILGFLILITK